MAAEEQFGVKIPDDELPKLKTVGDAVQATSSRTPDRESVAKDDIVVTGLGATTPIGGDVASYWACPARGALRGRGAHRGLGRAAVGAHRRAGWPSTRAEVLPRVRARRLDRSPSRRALVAAA